MMTTAEQEYWIAEGRIRQLRDDLLAELARAEATVAQILEDANG